LAGFETLPVGVGKNDDPVYVVRRHHKRVQRDMRIMVWQIQPATTYDACVAVLDHHAVRDPPNRDLRRKIQTVTKYAPERE
jgi:hypothetical protein